MADGGEKIDKREECMSDNLHIATSTPLKESDFPPLPTMNAPVMHQVVIVEDNIRRIAMAVKLFIQEELADLVN